MDLTAARLFPKRLAALIHAANAKNLATALRAITASSAMQLLVLMAFVALLAIAPGKAQSLIQPPTRLLETVPPGAIEVLLRWNTKDDLDLRLVCPTGEVIMFDTRTKCGGTLEFDSNSAAYTIPNSIERIRFPAGAAAPGSYRVEVVLYRKFSSNWPIEFTVELRINGEVKEQYSRRFTSTEKMHVASFAFSPAGGSSPPLGGPVASVPASPTTPILSSASEFGRRVALVMGNSTYDNAPLLPNPTRDAAAVAGALRRLGFQSVIIETNIGREKMIDALRNFARQAQSADWALVYFAGHGMEVGGTNYLLPIDANIESDLDMPFAAVPLDQVLNATDRARKLRLVILDACRNNPFANKMIRTASISSRSVVERGFGRVSPSAGTLVVYAAKDGETASDGDGANSPFTTALIRNLARPGIEVRRLFDNVRDDVQDLTRQRQLPYTYGSISGREDFYFLR